MLRLELPREPRLLGLKLANEVLLRLLKALLRESGLLGLLARESSRLRLLEPGALAGKACGLRPQLLRIKPGLQWILVALSPLCYGELWSSASGAW